MRKFPSFKRQGFTLIELLLVIAIISILANIVFVNVKLTKQKAKRAAALQSFQQITLAMNMYYDGEWPEGEFFFTLYWGYYNEDVPPFIPDFYPNWDATYYCSDCVYLLFLRDGDEDGKAGCSYIYIYNPDWSNYIYKNILCEDCALDCGAYGYEPS